MSLPVHHLRTAIVFPGDVKSERTALSKIIEKVNREFNALGLHIEVWAWDTDATPGFDPFGPQGVIDK